jgi:peptide-methionine (S)-S-oxide reductase
MTLPSDVLDSLFREAVAAIDAGDIQRLQRLLHDCPDLIAARLDSPGPWLRDHIGSALGGFFARPYLLWFVEDPDRNDRLPRNIAELIQVLVASARHAALPVFRNS